MKCAVYHSNEWYTLTAKGYQTVEVCGGFYGLIPEVTLTAPLYVAKMMKSEQQEKENEGNPNRPNY